MFMAHQDVVPVPANTVNDWTYPPWSGHYDGERVWGRGTISHAGMTNSRFVGLQEQSHWSLGGF